MLDFNHLFSDIETEGNILVTPRASRSLGA
jgi:hypothetical protein